MNTKGKGKKISNLYATPRRLQKAIKTNTINKTSYTINDVAHANIAMVYTCLLSSIHWQR